MSTEQERSFIACIRCDETKMKFFDQMLSSSAGQDNLLTTFHRYSETTKKMVRAQRAQDVNTRTRSDEMIVYFRCHGDYYNIQIRSEAYFGKYFSKNNVGILGAFPGAGGDTTSFNLLNLDQGIITLDDLKTNDATVYLKARHAGTVKRQLIQNPKIYCYGDQSGDTVTFNLRILERNVPYPTRAEPYPLYIEPRPHSDDD
ncbi:hypothetical protein [Pseudomonas frederiksbergensis]|nr:hypothetical protein [Pseudomonas frederiksbergensis]